VSYGIVQRHHGTLSIDTTERQGTTVTIALPATAGDLATGTIPGTGHPASGVTVLLIDDDAAVRDIMAQILRSYGHAVLEASSGREGILQLSDALDLVITDLGMPGMNGWEVVDAVKRIRSNLAVLLLTGWGGQPHGQRDGQAAPDAILAKPLSQEQLAAAVAQLTSMRRVRALAR
jgi:CheY-like chemotaxis protein